MIAIKGMEMPPCCLDCLFMQVDCENNQTLFFCELLQRYRSLFELLNTQRMKDCPLVEVEE